MNKGLLILTIVVAFGVMLATLPDGAIAVTFAAFCAVATIYIIRQVSEESDFLSNIFLAALLLRILLGAAIYVFGWQESLAGDALTYDFYGNRLMEIWSGQVFPNDAITNKATRITGPGWGMNYLVAIFYFIFGQNMLAAQFFCAVIGAATAPLVYICAHKIFQSVRVGKVSAILVAFFPAFIIWSSQLLKDGLIIFLLVLAITMVLQLQEKFSYFPVIVLIFSLFGIISLRFYIFYIVAIAVVGSFIIGNSSSVKSIIRGFATVAILGLVLSYIGVLQNAGDEFEKYGSLERIQASRGDLATKAESGYGEDLDVSTTQGALIALPIGFMYLMFAPFPWQITSLRAALTLPEILVWWAMFPLMISGLWYTLKNRLRNSIAILIFTFLLTIAYSITQGNVGTAYRQRTQIQVFLFIFIAVGWTLFKERRENQQVVRATQKNRNK